MDPSVVGEEVSRRSTCAIFHFFFKQAGHCRLAAAPGPEQADNLKGAAGSNQSSDRLRYSRVCAEGIGGQRLCLR